jgi:hypothetical protein
MRATCPVNLFIRDLITAVILDGQYKLRTSSFSSFLQSPFTPSLLGPNILTNTLFSDTWQM